MALDETVLSILAKSKKKTKLIFSEGLQCQIHSEMTAMLK